jgi:hypothetical protein
MKAGNYLGPDDQHIVENENFRKVDPEKDLKRWEAAESNAHWFSKCKKSTAVVIYIVLMHSSDNFIGLTFPSAVHFVSDEIQYNQKIHQCRRYKSNLFDAVK